MKSAWIAAEKATFRISQLCRALGVVPSGYYAWVRRPASARAQRDRRLKVLVRASHDASKRRYGSPRIHRDLVEQGELVSRKRVIRLMQEEGLEARARKRFKGTTHSDHDQPVEAAGIGQACRPVHRRGHRGGVLHRRDVITEAWPRGRERFGELGGEWLGADHGQIRVPTE